jgi:hypothetical protein
MPPAMDVPAGSTDCRAGDEEGWCADIPGDNDSSATSATPSSVAILARNVSSTCRTSAAVRLFLAPRIPCAQLVACSAEAILPIPSAIAGTERPMLRPRGLAWLTAKPLMHGDVTAFVGWNTGDRRSADHYRGRPVAPVLHSGRQALRFCLSRRRVSLDENAVVPWCGYESCKQKPSQRRRWPNSPEFRN